MDPPEPELEPEPPAPAAAAAAEGKAGPRWRRVETCVLAVVSSLRVSSLWASLLLGFLGWT